MLQQAGLEQTGIGGPQLQRQRGAGAQLQRQCGAGAQLRHGRGQLESGGGGQIQLTLASLLAGPVKPRAPVTGPRTRPRPAVQCAPPHPRAPERRALPESPLHGGPATGQHNFKCFHILERGIFAVMLMKCLQSPVGRQTGGELEEYARAYEAVQLRNRSVTWFWLFAVYCIL